MPKEDYGGIVSNMAEQIYLVNEKEYLLRIVYEESEGIQIVLTAYLTSQVKRYWKEEER